MPEKLVLRCNLSPGDVVMLTAAVRDLHLCHPGKFCTDVRTLCPDLWRHNPYVTPIADGDREAKWIECSYPLINDSNRLPYHCIHGFSQFLSQKLGLSIRPTALAGDIYVSPQERAWMSQVHEIAGRDIPFWLIVAGGKFDVTIKWWRAEYWQQVIDYFRGKIQFVQVGQPGHFHPPLSGVIDLRGHTSLRQLVRLVYHAQGVLCPVTCVMHLAAAVETRPGNSRIRPCVVVAGGREPSHWETYPFHQYIHTVGALPCCAAGGCWKARTFSLLDGDPGDSSLCVDTINELPRCMQMISPEEVIHRIERYFSGGAVRYLKSAERRVAQRAVRKTRHEIGDRLTVFTARATSESFIRSMRIPRIEWRGRGVVIPAGGPQYLPCAWVCIRMLRRLGCELPIELWHLGPTEMDSTFAHLIEELGVRTVDAHSIRKKSPARILNGWELKAYSILYSNFREVLLLDADNVPVVNSECLFECQEFAQNGAIFWPDYGRLGPQRSIWRLCGVPFTDEPEFESGQIVVDKERCARALRLALWYNEHSDFFFQHIHGDKDTFHLAFRKLKIPYAMPSTPIQSLEGVICQHDFAGRRIFQHRNSHKWKLFGPNKSIRGFLFENDCLQDLDELRELWPQKQGPSVARPAVTRDCGRRAPSGKLSARATPATFPPAA